MRYLVRLANDGAYTSKDVGALQREIRKQLWSHEKIGNLRVSTSAIEFDLFADQTDLEEARTQLESNVSKIVTLRPIENRASTRNETETLLEGVRLFNEERFWEAHEVLEEIWHPSTGNDRNTIQGLILTAAAFVHYQKDEVGVCLSILKRALEKLGSANDFRDLNIQWLRAEEKKMTDQNVPHLLQLRWSQTKTNLQTL